MSIKNPLGELVKWFHGSHHKKFGFSSSGRGAWICISDMFTSEDCSAGLKITYEFSSVQFSHSVMSDCLQPHEPQQTRPPCPLPIPGVHPNPCPLCQWCHLTTSSSVVPFFSCPQSFPASGSFQMSQLFASGGQILEFQLQHQVLQWTPRTDLL